MTPSGTTTLTCAAMFSMALGLGVARAQSSAATPDRPRALAPSTPNDATSQLSAAKPTAEHQFVPQVALANMAEIQLGHLAVKKAQRADVKKFAQMMIDDHLKAQNELADAASGANIRWPTQLDERHRQIQQRLSTLKDDQFDREYMKAMVDGHRDVEKILAVRVGEGGTEDTEKLQTPPSGGKPDASSLSAKVNQWAAKTLPAVRAHLQEAEPIYAGLQKGP